MGALEGVFDYGHVSRCSRNVIYTVYSVCIRRQEISHLNTVVDTKAAITSGGGAYEPAALRMCKGSRTRSKVFKVSTRLFDGKKNRPFLHSV